MSKQQNPQTNLKPWDVATDFTGYEVAALAVGEEPAEESTPSVKARPLYRKLEKSYNAARRWHNLDDNAPLIWDEIGVSSKDELLESIGLQQTLSHFDRDEAENLASWLTSDEHSGFSTQRFARAEIARWLNVIGVQSVYEFDSAKPSKEESLSTKERTSLLKMIVAMAIGGYGYDPKSSNNGEVIGTIQTDLATYEVPLSDDTIRNYLKEAVKNVLPVKTLDQPKIKTEFG
ncbi:hypothetical protein HUU62_23595 [Rhodoferax sp. 4810]|nr:hypothetical protein [Rhodoferax jenense]